MPPFWTWYAVIMSKISDKTDRFLLNYSYLFWGPLFIGTQCISLVRPVITFKSMGCCNNVGKEICVTCLQFLTLFFMSCKAATDDLYKSYEVFLCKDVPYGVAFILFTTHRLKSLKTPIFESMHDKHSQGLLAKYCILLSYFINYNRTFALTIAREHLQTILTYILYLWTVHAYKKFNMVDSHQLEN